LPRAFAHLCRLLERAQLAPAEAFDQRLRPVYDFLGVESNPIPLKALLGQMGIGTGLRLPLLSLSAEHAEVVDRIAGLCREIETQLQ
ncbi:MAG: dihydrodipicolinate synthase family protein, partial [Arenimonas sp.]